MINFNENENDNGNLDHINKTSVDLDIDIETNMTISLCYKQYLATFAVQFIKKLTNTDRLS